MKVEIGIRITGEQGSGKTRLLDELKELLLDKGFEITTDPKREHQLIALKERKKK